MLILLLQEPSPQVKGKGKGKGKAGRAAVENQTPCALEFPRTRAPEIWHLSPKTTLTGPEYACRLTPELLQLLLQMGISQGESEMPPIPTLLLGTLPAAVFSVSCPCGLVHGSPQQSA